MRGPNFRRVSTCKTGSFRATMRRFKSRSAARSHAKGAKNAKSFRNLSADAENSFKSDDRWLGSW